MKPCTDCGGDVGRGWTNPSDHDHCASCDIARALGTPIPPRQPKVGEPITADMLARLNYLEGRLDKLNAYKRTWDERNRPARRAKWRTNAERRRRERKLAVLRSMRGGK